MMTRTIARQRIGERVQCDTTVVWITAWAFLGTCYVLLDDDGTRYQLGCDLPLMPVPQIGERFHLDATITGVLGWRRFKGFMVQQD